MIALINIKISRGGDDEATFKIVALYFTENMADIIV